MLVLTVKELLLAMSNFPLAVVRFVRILHQILFKLLVLRGLFDSFMCIW